MHRAVRPDRKTATSSSHVNVVKESIGNATKESDTSLTFNVDKKKLKNITSLPFQVIAYHTCLTQYYVNTIGSDKISEKGWFQMVENSFSYQEHI